MKVMIGIPCYRDVAGETLEDYMRFAFYCGRRTEHEYILGIKTKSEQFRARNAIVTGALQTACDYLLFLDDDHVLDWEVTPGPNQRYGIVDQLIKHFEADEKLGVCGAVYYHRGAECRPVLMKEGKDGGFYWLRDDEITGGLQEVAVQGGGCMMLRLSMFDKIPAPWFEPEFDLGTDIQICKKAREAGYKVCCDTSIQIGHVMSKREIVTPQNRIRISMDNARNTTQQDEGMDVKWLTNNALRLYRMDAEEYLGIKYDSMFQLAMKYDMDDIKNYEDVKDYYKSRGKEQLARQVMFHHTDHMVQQMEIFHGMINTNTPGYGADIACGSAPVTFELAMRGHEIDFIDLDGADAYEFTKWRAEKRNIKCGFELKGPYDYIFMLDSIEHIEDWQSVLKEVSERLKKGGAFITNYFGNMDYENPEHISMDKKAVKKFLTEHGIYPLNEILWVKQDLGFMDRETKMSILKRTVYYGNDGNGNLRFLDWAKVITSIGVMVEPVVVNGRVIPGGNNDLNSNDPTDIIRMVNEMEEIDLTKYKNVLSCDSGTVLHGGSILPYSGR